MHKTFLENVKILLADGIIRLVLVDNPSSFSD